VSCHSYKAQLAPGSLGTVAAYIVSWSLNSLYFTTEWLHVRNAKRHFAAVDFLQILEETEQHKIRIYEFPECDSDEDEEFKQQDRELKVNICVNFVLNNRHYSVIQADPSFIAHKQ